MNSLRQIGTGLLLSILSIVVVLGAFSLAMAEGGLVAVAPPTNTNTPAPIVLTIFPTLPPFATNTPEGAVAASLTPTASFTPPPPPTTCPPPAGWLPVVIQPNDTLASIAQTYRTSEQALLDANCLFSSDLVAGTFLYVPPQPTATRVPCGAPPGWINYIVRPNDTLYQIGLAYRVSVQELQRANCLLTSNIKAGQIIKVPNVIPSTPIAPPSPIPTITEVPSAIPTGTASPTPEPPPATTEVPSSTPALETETPPPTDTEVPPPTDTEVPPPTETTEPLIPPTPEETATS